MTGLIHFPWSHHTRNALPLGVPVRDKDLVTITGKIGFRIRGVKTIEYFLAEEIERFGKKFSNLKLLLI